MIRKEVSLLLPVRSDRDLGALADNGGNMSCAELKPDRVFNPRDQLRRQYVVFGHLHEEYDLLVGVRLSTAADTQGILALGREVREQDIILANMSVRMDEKTHKEG